MQVGNTPLIKLSDKLYGKLESVNPGGSIKDRPVKYILDRMDLNKGDTIIEATSGNTGISLAMMCAERGYKCIIVMPSDMSEERKNMLKFFGAHLIEVGAGDFDEAISSKESMAKKYGYKELNQFNNPLNIECHYKTTFEEIIDNLPPGYMISSINYPGISAFICGTGTGGTLMGLQRGVEDYELDTKIIAVEPLESPVMSGGEKGLHGIQGIGDGSKFLVDLDKVDEVITISTKEAKDRSLRLAKENGLFVGISAGANVLASEQWLEKNNPDGIVVTILCDRGERYFSIFDEKTLGS
jgi:cysteine synthase A